MPRRGDRGPDGTGRRTCRVPPRSPGYGGGGSQHDERGVPGSHRGCARATVAIRVQRPGNAQVAPRSRLPRQPRAVAPTHAAARRAPARALPGCPSPRAAWARSGTPSTSANRSGFIVSYLPAVMIDSQHSRHRVASSPASVHSRATGRGRAQWMSSAAQERWETSSHSWSPSHSSHRWQNHATSIRPMQRPRWLRPCTEERPMSRIPARSRVKDRGPWLPG